MTDVTASRAVSCYRFADLVVASDESLPELPAALPGIAPDVAVSRARVPFRAPVRWFQTWSAGGDPVRFGRSDGGYVVSFRETADVIVSPDADRIVIHAAEGLSDFKVRHVLLHQILPLVLSRRGRCVLHASAVSWRDRVIAFVGRTGAGKSTIAAACASVGAALVTDDSLVLDRAAGTWHGLPSYPGLRIHPESLDVIGRSRTNAALGSREDRKILLTAGHDLPAFELRTLPLAWLVLVSAESSGESLRLVRGSAAAIALASHLFRLDVEDATESRRLFDSITDLAATIPVSELHLPRGVDLRPLVRPVLEAAGRLREDGA